MVPELDGNTDITTWLRMNGATRSTAGCSNYEHTRRLRKGTEGEAVSTRTVAPHLADGVLPDISELEHGDRLLQEVHGPQLEACYHLLLCAVLAHQDERHIGDLWQERRLGRGGHHACLHRSHNHSRIGHAVLMRLKCDPTGRRLLGLRALLATWP